MRRGAFRLGEIAAAAPVVAPAAAPIPRDSSWPVRWVASDAELPLLDLVAEIREFAPVRRVVAAMIRAEDAAGRRALAYQQYERGDYAGCMAAAAGLPGAELLWNCAQVMTILHRGTRA